MIRYNTTVAELTDKIGARWLADAAERTAAFRAAGKYTEKAGSWSKVKPVYMQLQHGKCAYCERQFGSDPQSRIEHDIEHFRPKSSVKVWPPAGATFQYSFPTGPASDVGYFLLPYNLLNYAAACKKCNSSFKANYFPIEAAARAVDADTPEVLAGELPLLIYPIAEVDDDPEDLLSFEGFVPVAVKRRGRKARRARVIIDFFALDTREELLRERAFLLKAIYVAHRNRKSRDPLVRDDSLQTLAQIDLPGFPHRNCARAFSRLCVQDTDTAREYYGAAIQYLRSFGA